ncbi:MAG: hypothetical protein HOD97_03985 [Candidatus Marinimicrobia bacterium]|jgi:hypothetical protein|nr:hypothetical protein [Candidatus Neomarinimicrobiota bacterium]MBT3617781.1 hypothetical protein [Candidatus Neomarinimicrobiota bacterium]MBT3828344.1 hypothetical protein [Candidatus Neomarinimicrobiota bacterium]MBT3997602.1 hypothetical protein [Candidatus Neomarinimicrobiota bacterium]MBT4280763.1 hypothetical protein [Candidatus Neomarinimicrobiota bacterium]
MKIFILLMATSLSFGQEYVGSKKCKSCHNKEKSGAQYVVWNKSPHAHSYETLKTPAAKETAINLGITTNPWETPECVRCHTTAFGKGGYELKDEAFWNQVTKKDKPTKDVKRMAGLQNVGCEACHGPGSKYKSKKKMDHIFYGKIDQEKFGLITPSEKVCKQCHNEESPNFKAFDYEKSYAAIAHPYPDGFRKMKMKKRKK